MIPIRDNIPSRTTPFVNLVLIALCLFVFIIQWVQSRQGEDRLTETFGMIPLRIQNPEAGLQVPEIHRVRTIFGEGLQRSLRVIPPLPFSPWWTMLTAIFLHGGILHLVGNLWFLWIFGDNVEDRMGHGRYLLFYLCSGVAGNLGHYWANPDSYMPVIGASGAIAGVMGAYLLLYPHAKVLTLIPIFFFLHFMVIPAPVFLGFWFLIQFFQGALSISPLQTAGEAGVAWWAHIGGFVAGFVIAGAFLLSGTLRPPVRERRLRPW